jgi:hypothetical protein
MRRREGERIVREFKGILRLGNGQSRPQLKQRSQACSRWFVRRLHCILKPISSAVYSRRKRALAVDPHTGRVVCTSSVYSCYQPDLGSFSPHKADAWQDLQGCFWYSPLAEKWVAVWLWSQQQVRVHCSVLKGNRAPLYELIGLLDTQGTFVRWCSVVALVLEFDSTVARSREQTVLLVE